MPQRHNRASLLLAALTASLLVCISHGAIAGQRRVNLAHCKAELRKCDPVKGTCIFVGFPIDSDCDNACKAKLLTKVEALVQAIPKAAYSPKGVHGCVGFRPDLGGTEYGAMCLAKGLGYRYEPDSCNVSGWAYNIIAE